MASGKLAKPPPQDPDHTLTAHIWIWGSPCTPLIMCLATTMHGKQKSRRISFQRLSKNKLQKQKKKKKTLGALMASTCPPPMATHNDSSQPHGMSDRPAPGSKISLNSFHLISGAMLAFPPGKLPFAIWQTYPDPPPESRSHLDSSHLDLGITFAFL